jgi:hypothetical protein
MHGSDPYQSGYPYSQPMNTMEQFDHAYSFSEETLNNSCSRGYISLPEQGPSMSRALSNGSHSSDSTYGGVSPQTPNTAWPMDPPTNAYFNYGEQNTETGYYNGEYAVATTTTDDGSWYQSGGSYSTMDYYSPGQSDGYAVSPVATTAPQASMEMQM